MFGIVIVVTDTRCSSVVLLILHLLLLHQKLLFIKWSWTGRGFINGSGRCLVLGTRSIFATETRANTDTAYQKDLEAKPKNHGKAKPVAFIDVAWCRQHVRVGLCNVHGCQGVTALIDCSWERGLTFEDLDVVLRSLPRNLDPVKDNRKRNNPNDSSYQVYKTVKRWALPNIFLKRGPSHNKYW